MLIARMLTRAYGVTIRSCQGAPHTNGKTIYLPLVEAASHENKRVVHGYLDHESAHVIHTDFDDFGSEIKRRLRGEVECKIPQLYKDFFNLLEDMRIEKAMGRRYPGSKSNLAQMAEYISREQPDIARMSPFGVIFAQLFGDLRRDMLGQPVPHYPELDRAAQAYLDGRYSELLAVAMQVDGASSTLEVSKVTDQALAKLSEIIADNTRKYQPPPDAGQSSDEKPEPAPLVEPPPSESGDGGEDGEGESNDSQANGSGSSGESEQKDSAEPASSDGDSGEDGSGEDDSAKADDAAGKDDSEQSDESGESGETDSQGGEDGEENSEQAGSDEDEAGSDPSADGDEGDGEAESGEDAEAKDDSKGEGSDADDQGKSDAEDGGDDSGDESNGEDGSGTGSDGQDDADAGKDANGEGDSGEDGSDAGDQEGSDSGEGDDDGSDAGGKADDQSGNSAGEKGEALTEDDVRELGELTDEERRAFDVAKALAEVLSQMEGDADSQPEDLCEQVHTAQGERQPQLEPHVSSTAARMQALLEERTERKRIPRLAGALNRRQLHRAAVGDPYIFDRKIGVEYDTRANVVLLLDRSGSMRADGKHECLAQSSYVIAGALESFGVHTAILGFGDSWGTTMVKEWDQPLRRDRLFPIATGGTSLAPALRWADALLAYPPDPQAKNIVITLTDGVPHYPQKCLYIASDMQARGINCNFIGILCDIPLFEQFPHCVVGSVAELPQAFGKLAIDSITEALAA